MEKKAVDGIHLNRLLKFEEIKCNKYDLTTIFVTLYTYKTKLSGLKTIQKTQFEICCFVLDCIN